MANAGNFYFGDADAVSFTGAGISTTTAATAVTALTLTQDRRILNLVNFSNTTVFVARKSVRSTSAPVVFEALPTTAGAKWDFRTNNHGFQKGDVLYLYAPGTPTGDVFISAL